MSEKVSVVIKEIPELKKLCGVYGLSSNEYLKKLLKGTYTSYLFHIQCMLYPEDIDNIKLHYDEIYNSHSIIEERTFQKMNVYKDSKYKLLKIAEKNEYVAKLIKDAELAYKYNKLAYKIEIIPYFKRVDQWDDIAVDKFYELRENNDFTFLEKCGVLIYPLDYDPMLPF